MDILDIDTRKICINQKVNVSCAYRFVFQEQDKREKGRLLGLYINLVQSLSAFDSQVFLSRATGLMPNPDADSIITRVILCHESLAESDLPVTLSFLDLIATLFRPTLPKASPFNISEEMPMPFQCYYTFALSFVCENILPGLLNWRIREEECRHELIIRCLRIFLNLFSVHEKWIPLKDACCSQLIGPKSPLLYILTTTGNTFSNFIKLNHKLSSNWLIPQYPVPDEYTVQESMIKTTPTNRQVPKVVDIALNLIVKLANYKREVLHVSTRDMTDQIQLIETCKRNIHVQALDNHSGLAVVQKLGQMLRHRVNTSIPTFSVLLLKKFAEESNMSLQLCLGEDVVSFCDLVIQRLQFKTEDTQLKVTENRLKLIHQQ